MSRILPSRQIVDRVSTGTEGSATYVVEEVRTGTSRGFSLRCLRLIGRPQEAPVGWLPAAGRVGPWVGIGRGQSRTPILSGGKVHRSGSGGDEPDGPFEAFEGTHVE